MAGGILKEAFICLAFMCLGGLLVYPFLHLANGENEALRAKVETLEATNMALAAASQAQISLRAENARLEEKNAVNLEKITAGDLPDCDYYAALARLLREAGAYCPGIAASGAAGGLPGPVSE